MPDPERRDPGLLSIPAPESSGHPKPASIATTKRSPWTPFKAHRYRSSQKPCRQVPPEQEELSMQAVQRVFPVAWESK